MRWVVHIPDPNIFLFFFPRHVFEETPVYQVSEMEDRKISGRFEPRVRKRRGDTYSTEFIYEYLTYSSYIYFALFCALARTVLAKRAEYR